MLFNAKINLLQRIIHFEKRVMLHQSRPQISFQRKSPTDRTVQQMYLLFIITKSLQQPFSVNNEQNIFSSTSLAIQCYIQHSPAQTIVAALFLFIGTIVLNCRLSTISCPDRTRTLSFIQLLPYHLEKLCFPVKTNWVHRNILNTRLFQLNIII